MIPTNRKEELSISYLNALCAVQGIAMERRKHDNDGIDFNLHKEIICKDDISKFRAQFDVQLKASSSGYTEYENHYAYAIDMKIFNDLRRPATVKPYIFLLILPKEEQEWLIHTIDELMIKKCMFWLDLLELPPSDNTSNITLHFPKENVVTLEQLEEFLQKSASEIA